MQKSEQDKVKKLEWMLDETVSLSDNERDEYNPPYGDVTKLNSCRLIMDSVGAETLKEIGKNAIKLLDTSVAIYEANGDYAFGMFSSGWCRLMDSASRELCKTDDNREALSCGKWLCHENCWNDSAKKAIETGRSTDIECVGGIHLYGEPIYAGQKVIGAINIGYGDPPKDRDQLNALADAFGIDPEKLKKIGESYKSRPTFIVDVTKKLLAAFAKLIGEIVEKAKAERKQKEAQAREVHLKNVLKAILDVNQLIVKENDPHRLIQKACENLTGAMGYFNAWIALLDKDSRCVTQTGAAVSDGDFAPVRDNLNRGVFPACMQRALEKSELVVMKDLAVECHDCPLASRDTGHSALTHRLEHEGAIFGVLSVSTSAQFAHDTEEQDLFLEVSNDLAFALSKIETDKELQLKNQIIQTTPQPMAIVSSDYRYLVVNQAYCRVYGTAPENITGRPVADFVSPAVFEQEIRPRLDRCLTGEAIQYEIQMDFPGTGPCWMRMEYTPYRDKDNRIVGVVSHGMDITARKRAEEQRESLARKYASVLNSTSDAVVAGELDGRITVFNPGAEKLFGCTADEALGTLVSRFCPEDRLAEQAEMMRRIRDEGTVTDYETERLTADGRRIPVEISLGLNTDDRGRPLEINAIVRDITRRKQAEEALRESLQRLEFALQGGNLGMWDWNPQDGAVVYSDLWAQMLEYRPDEVEPTVDFFKQHVHPEDLSAVLDRLTGHVEGRLPVYESEHRIRTRSGRWLWVLDHGRIVERAKDGRPVRVTGLISDITVRKEAEEALRKRIKEMNAFYHLSSLVEKPAMVLDELYQEMANVLPQSWQHPDVTCARIVISDREFRSSNYAESRWNQTEIIRVNSSDVGRIDVGCIAEKPEQDEWPFLKEERKLIRAIAERIGHITERRRAEELLLVSEEKHRRLFETMAQGVVYQAADGAIISANPAAERILGLSFEQMQGKTSMDPRWKMILEDGTEVPGTDHPAMLALRTGETVGPVIRGVFHPDKNAYVWLSITAIPLFQPGETKPFQTYATFEDVTEHRQAVEALREREAFIKATLDNLPVGVAVNSVDPKVNFTYMNDNFAKFYRTTREALAAPNDFWEVVYLDATFREEIKKRVLEDCASNDPERMHWKDVPVSRPGKKPFYITAKNIPLIESNLMVSTVWDVTDRKQAEERLRRVNDELLRIGRMALVGGWSVDLKSEKHEWSEVTREIHEVGPDFIPGFQSAVSFYKDGESRRKITDVVAQCMETGKSYDVDVQIVTAKGRECWVRTMGAAEFQDGRCVRLYGTFQDISDRKKIEQEREKLQAQLVQAQKMESVGRLAGGVAHDFNNMLNIILGNTEMAMEDTVPDDPLQDTLGEIFSAARRSADITRQLLAFARKQTIAPKVIDLNDAIESMLKMLRRLIGEDINLAWLPGANIRQVMMDPSQIDQILANLCVNARDAIADVGKITIETGNTTFDSAYCAEHPGFKAGDFVLLAVSDDGCGMDQETLANVFEPFFTTKEVGKGTGLGLATVFGIVKQNGSFINVYSEPDQGTTFRIYLPRYRAETESPMKKTADKIVMGGTETILLVEDEPSILRMTRMMLERNGYKVLAAGTPGEAISLAREHVGPIHLLMTDVVMPEMNGRDLAKNVLSLYPHLKCLFMSGYTANVIAHRGVLDEGVNFIQKPFSKADLADKVRDALDNVSDKAQG